MDGLEVIRDVGGPVMRVLAVRGDFVLCAWRDDSGFKQVALFHPLQLRRLAPIPSEI